GVVGEQALRIDARDSHISRAVAAVLAKQQVLAVRRIGNTYGAAAAGAGRAVGLHDLALGEGTVVVDAADGGHAEDRDGLRGAHLKDGRSSVAGGGDDRSIADDPRVGQGLGVGRARQCILVHAYLVGWKRLGRLSDGELRKTQPDHHGQGGECTQTMDTRPTYWMLISRRFSWHMHRSPD